MVRLAMPAPDGFNESVVTLRIGERALDEAVVVRLTTSANPLRLVIETVVVMDEPC